MAGTFSREQLTAAFKAADAVVQDPNATPEERAGAEQDARQFVTAMDKLRAQEVAPADNGFINTMGRRMEQGFSGVNEGLSNIAGLPVDLSRGAINYGIDGVNAVSDFAGFPTEIDQLKPGYGSSQNFNEVMTAGNMIAPVDPRHATARKIGKYTGEGLGMVVSGGTLAGPKIGTSILGNILAAPARMIQKNPVSGTAKVAAAETIASGGAVVGEDFGEEKGEEWGGSAAELIGMDRATGEKYGKPMGKTMGALAGAMTPSVVGGSVVAGTKAAFNTPNSEKVFDALEKHNITPSAGLVGNKNAGLLENAPGNVPVVGYPVTRKQALQNTQFGRALEDSAEIQRGKVEELEVIDPANIGGKIRNAAQEGIARQKNEISTRETNLAKNVGEDSYINITGSRQAIDDLKPATDVTRRKALTDEKTTLEANAKPVYPPKQALLQTDLAGLEGILAKLTPGTEQYNRVVTQMGGIKTQIAENRQIPYTNMRDVRNNLGKTVDGTQGISAGQKKVVYSSMTDDLRKGVAKTGDENLAEFDAINKISRRVRNPNQHLADGGDVPHLEKLVLKDSKQIYDQVIRGGQQNWEQLDVVRRNSTPEQWKDITADNIKLMGQPPAGSRLNQTMTADDFSPGVFLTNWGKLSDKSKALMFGDGSTRSLLDDLAVATGGFKKRTRSGNPSGTATTLISTSAASSAAVGAFTNLPATVAAALGIAGFSGAISSNMLARVIAGKHPDIAQRLMNRLPGNTARGVDAATED